jgi:Domain of unknown function (DUF6779)
MLLTVLLVLAIGASSALVFTNRVELLKLAVILALWAAVVAAFVSVLYRRQSDIDQARARDLKLVYDLQLDREISARREYELTVESQLRRELASELRAQAADEVAGLRAELAALRANLEILFDADLSQRPALESDLARAYNDWPGNGESAGRVTASRIDAEDREEVDANTEESPIIDVPAEPHPPEADWPPQPAYGGAHRRPSETEQEGRRHTEEAPQAWSPPPPPPQPVPVPPAPPPSPEPDLVAQASSTDWQPAPAEGQWIPVGTPGSNWVSSAMPNSSAEPTVENGSADEYDEYVGKRRVHEEAPTNSPAQPAMQSPDPRGRHSAPPDAVDPGRPPAPPTLVTQSDGPPPHPEPEAPLAQQEARRHRSAEDTGGQSVADLLARLQATSTGGGRRRRRDE